MVRDLRGFTHQLVRLNDEPLICCRPDDGAQQGKPGDRYADGKRESGQGTDANSHGESRGRQDEKGREDPERGEPYTQISVARAHQRTMTREQQPR